MCLSCGCKQPNEAHGDERNITLQGLEQAAQASGIQPEEAAKNIQEGFREFGGQMAGAGTGQRTGNNAQKPDERQGGYGSGGSNGPQ